MRIHLEQLPHQEKAIENILVAMKDCLDQDSNNPNANYVYANPVIKRMRGVDIKMETGTGKTYVYTRLTHELYRQFGLNKFIIMTPSLAIKEGVKAFINSESAVQHFRELYQNQKINLGVVNAGDFNTRKGKRKQFAGSLTDFCDASRSDIGTVNILLLNDAMLGSKSMTRDDYDQTLIGSSSCPLEALKLTRPIVIIDEPHRFKKGGTAWQNILSLNPQLIIRFGATFPESKYHKKDYDNLVYDLSAVESFNQGLVKGVVVNYPNLPEDQAEVKYRVEVATNKKLTLSRSGRQYTIQTGEELSIIDPLFEGDTTYEGKILSNDLEVAPGMTLIPSVWGNSYQELILRQAIDAHFSKENELFNRPGNAPRIRVLSLYFIDSIHSYRDNDGWLKKTFERLLKAKLTTLIKDTTGEYRDYLTATLASLTSDDQKVHAGYFAEDTGKKGDEAIQAEVDDILRNKEAMLQFKDVHGHWNVRRFLFSKWTLREGWDNPNVFVLTKLRSSGSESSKIQEVGRGLRLPVDELGNRLSTENFYLDFIIDYSEKDFAQKLVGEINADGGIVEGGKITDSILDLLVDTKYADNRDGAFFKLGGQGIVDHDRNILKPDELEKLIPLGVKRNKVRIKRDKNPVVHVRRDNWDKISKLWDQTSKRFMLRYNQISTREIIELTRSICAEKRVFCDTHGTITRLTTVYDKQTQTISLNEQQVTLDQEYGQIKYGPFLQKISRATNLPIPILHQCVTEQLKNDTNVSQKFNDLTAQNFVEQFKVKFFEYFSQKYDYDSLDFTANIKIESELAQGLVGTEVADDISLPSNYLYDEAVYDSEIEHDILKLAPHPQVLVFGKLPRRSIKIPTFTGGTTSPDFVYAIKEKDSSKIKIHALIEAKGKDDMSRTKAEDVALLAQDKISEKLDNVSIRLVNKAQEVDEIIRNLV